MTTYIIIGVVVLLLLLLFFTGYLKAPPDTAYIISGLGRKRILIGKAGWRVPFFERVDKLSLRVMQVDVRTSEAVPTNEFINVTVDGVANVKVSSDPELLQLAAEALLGKRPEELVSLVTQVMEGQHAGDRGLCGPEGDGPGPPGRGPEDHRECGARHAEAGS